MKKIKFLFLAISLNFGFANAQSPQWTTSGSYTYNTTTANLVGIGTSSSQPFKLSINGTGVYDSKFGINGWQTLYLPDQTTYIGSLAIGNGLTSLAHSSGVDGQYNTSVGLYSLISNTYGALNASVGYYSLGNNTTGSYNNAFGHASLASNQGGGENTAVGDGTLFYNVSGSYNSTLGFNALYNSTGGYNVGMGANALITNTTGNNNTAIGSNADVLINNLTNATAIGFASRVGQSNSLVLGGTGSYAVNVGVGTPTPNTAALLDLTSSTQGLLLPRVALTATNSSSPLAAMVAGMTVYNTATAGSGSTAVTPGFYYNDGTTWISPSSSAAAGSWSINGNSGLSTANYIGTNDNAPLNFKINNTNAGILDVTDKVGFGLHALESAAPSARGVVAIGGWALEADYTGEANVGIGAEALTENYGGSYNTAVGAGAAAANISGGYNTAVGEVSLGNNYTGSYNTAVGNQALLANNTGSNNTAIGSGANVSASNLSNATAIGTNAIATASNYVVIGSTSITKIGGYQNWTNFSDGRYKKNIKENVPGLEFINKLRPITYTLDVTGINKKLRSNLPIVDKKGRKINYPQDDSGAVATVENRIASGFIAQEVEKTAKGMNYNFDGVATPQNENDFYGLSYSQFVVPLVKAVQELSVQNDTLKNTIAQQAETNNDLQKQLNDLKATVLQMQVAMSQCCNSFSSSMKTPVTNQTTTVNSDNARLEQNIPNPYNSTTVIRYYVPTSSEEALLSITDVNGQTLKTVELSSKGSGQVTINAGTLSSGNYFYTLLVDGRRIDTKQMILTK